MQMGDEGSPEVSSSSPAVTGVSPVPSLASSDIGEVDLEFWDLDLNAHHSSPNRGRSGGASSESSGSVSGRVLFR